MKDVRTERPDGGVVLFQLDDESGILGRIVRALAVIHVVEKSDF